MKSPGPVEGHAGKFKPEVGVLRAHDVLKLDLAGAAKEIQQVMEKRNETSLAVGAFTGPVDIPCSGGPGIAQALTVELKQLRIDVRRDARLTVKGRYDMGKEGGSGFVEGRLQLEIVDRSGRIVHRVEKKFTGVEKRFTGAGELASLLGLTFDIRPGDDAKVVDKKLRASVDSPHVHIRGSQLAATRESPYALEILAGPDRNHLAQRIPLNRKGVAFVPIKRKEVYGVRLINNASHEVAVRLTIDGLSLFAFSEQKGYTCVVIPAKGTAAVGGWHITNTLVHAFSTTEYTQAAAGVLTSKAPIGTITACFAAAWAEGEPPPPDEPKGGSRSGDSTGFGPRVSMSVIQVKRKVGVLRAAVSVRYVKE